jgi:hypothetical protein
MPSKSVDNVINSKNVDGKGNKEVIEEVIAEFNATNLVGGAGVEIVSDTKTGITSFSSPFLFGSWFVPMAGVVDSTFELMGTNHTLASGRTSSIDVVRTLGNQHCAIRVNSITGNDDITIIGASISEANQVPIVGDTEILPVDAIGLYQTNKKWLDITNVVIGAGITEINYDIISLGYFDMGNKNTIIDGYRADIRVSGRDSDLAIQIFKVQDDGNKKCSIVEIEHYGFDSDDVANTTDFVDFLRTGANDRTYQSLKEFPNNEVACFKILDFSTYFTNDENVFESSNKAEGIIVQFTGCNLAGDDVGINEIDHATLTIFGRQF